eukprot:8582193-Pyramimonas_sp.AAC.1
MCTFSGATPDTVEKVGGGRGGTALANTGSLRHTHAHSHRHVSDTAATHRRHVNDASATRQRCVSDSHERAKTPLTYFGFN